MMMIYKEMALFGTSEARLDITRGIKKIKELGLIAYVQKLSSIIFLRVDRKNEEKRSLNV